MDWLGLVWYAKTRWYDEAFQGVLYTRPSPPTSLLSPSQLSPDEGPAAAALGEFLRK